MSDPHVSVSASSIVRETVTEKVLVVIPTTQAPQRRSTGGSGGGHVILDEGATSATRSRLNFTGLGVSVSDDSGNDATIVNIPGTEPADVPPLDAEYLVRTANGELTNEVVAGSAAFLDVPTSGNATSGEVVKGSDTRLTDSRAPSGSAGGDLTGTYPNPTLATSGVTAATYGSATQVPVTTFDAKGRATSVTNTTITGVTPATHATSHGSAGSDPVSLAASQIASGTVATARLGSGTANAGTFLRGDQTWAAISGSGASDWINVLDYATGDGVADDTAEIDSAIAAAGSGGTLWFPEGTYLVTPTPGTNLVPLDGQTWLGPGVIKMSGAGQHGIVGTSTTGVTFDGLTFDGGGVSGSTANITTLLKFDSATDLTIRNCELRNAVGPITNTSTSGRCALDIKDSTRAVVTDNYFHDIGWHPGDDWKNYADTNGQCIRANGAQDGIIARNEFTDHVSDSIFMGYGTRFTKNMRIAGNYIHDVMYAGINIFTNTSAGGTGGQGLSGILIQGNLIQRTNGVERGNRPGKRTLTVVSGNGSSTIVVTLSGPIVGHSGGGGGTSAEKVQVFDGATGTVRGDTWPGQTDTKATTTWTAGAPGAPAGNTMASTDTTPKITLTFPSGVAPTLSDGDQVAVIETGESSFGIYTRGGITPADIQVLDNVIEYTNEPGIEVNDHPATVRGNTIRDTQWVSLTTASDRPGIYCASGSIIEGNTVINPWGHGITCEDQNYHSGTGQVTDSRGQVRTMVRNNTIIGANYGGALGATGLLTSGWTKHFQNSIAHAGVNFIADYGSISQCVIEGNVISTADTTLTYPVGHGVRLRVATGFTADSSNIVRNNTLLDTPKDYTFRYPLNSVTTAFGYKAVTTTTTLTQKDHRVVCTGSSAYTVTLPTAVKGHLDGVTIVNLGTATVTIDANGSETINGSLTIPLYAGASVTLRSDFVSAWYATSGYRNTVVGFILVDKNADYTAAAGEHVRLGGTTALTAGRTVTLPGSSSTDGDEVMVTLADPSGSAYKGTVAPGSGTTLERNDGTNFILYNRGASWIFRYDATNAVWRMRLASNVDRVRTRSYADNTSITLDCSYDHITIPSLTGAGTTFGVPTGSKTDGQRLTLRITDTTPTGITFTTGSSGAFSTTTGGPALPTTTVNGILYLEFLYNSTTDRWELLRAV